MNTTKGFDYVLNEGDIETITKAWLQYEPAIKKAAASYAHTYRIIGGMTAEDLVISAYEPFLKAFKSYDIGTGVPLEAWIITKVKHSWRQFTRSTDAMDNPGNISIDSPAHPYDEDDETTIGDSLIDEDAETAEQIISDMAMCGCLEIIKQIISTLPDDIKEAVTKRYLEGYELKEISVPNAASKVHTGLRMIRKELRRRNMYLEGGLHYDAI